MTANKLNIETAWQTAKAIRARIKDETGLNASAVELFLAAARKGIVAMGWDLLCPRCRGAKVRVSRLDELPKGAHCSSCNIDYARNFSRNVELTFHPEP